MNDIMMISSILIAVPAVVSIKIRNDTRHRAVNNKKTTANRTFSVSYLDMYLYKANL